MEIMNQGDKYEEEKTEVLEDTKPRIPKKLLIVGGGVMLIGISIAAFFGNGGGKPASTPSATAIPSAQSGGFTDVNGNPVADPFAVKYTPEDIKTLRDNGYTGTEIEEGQKVQKTVKYMVEQAKAGREALLKKMYVELDDKVRAAGSPEFKQLLALTWLQGKPITVSSPDPTKYQADRVKENCRYTKIPSRGTQLFIKLVLDSTGEAIFMNVTPQRYNQLKDDGNMVINYDKVTFGSNSYVTNVVEVAI
jgi:hypothetical protein